MCSKMVKACLKHCISGVTIVFLSFSLCFLGHRPLLLLLLLFRNLLITIINLGSLGFVSQILLTQLQKNDESVQMNSLVY